MNIEINLDLQSALEQAKWWEDHMCGKNIAVRDLWATAQAGDVSMTKLAEIGVQVYAQWVKNNA